MRSRNDFAGAGGDADDDAVGQDARAAGDAGAVAAGLADDRGRLAGDGRLVDRGDAFDDLAVAGDDLAGLDHDDGRPACRSVETVSSMLAVCQLRGRPGVAWRVLRRASAWALPRASARAAAKLANSTVRNSQIVERQQVAERRPGSCSRAATAMV